MHEVRQGELVLENTRAIFGLPAATNYVVRVRMCVKELLRLRGTRLPGVGFRSSQGGGYLLGALPDDKELWLGADYFDADKRHRIGTMVHTACKFVVGQWYSLQVEARGTHIQLLVDGRRIIDTQDESFSQGTVKLLAGNARVHFDDFSVQLLP